MSKTRRSRRTTQRVQTPPLQTSYTRKANGEYVYKPLTKTQRERSLRYIRKHLEKRQRIPKEDTDLLVNFRNQLSDNVDRRPLSPRLLPPPPTEPPPPLEVGFANALLDLKHGKYDGPKGGRPLRRRTMSKKSK